MHFTYLPTELIIQILASTSFRDILVCREVCRSLKDIIEDSLELQYSIELGSSGYVDGPNDQVTKMSREERYRKLVELEEGWKTLHFPTAQTKTFYTQSSIYELYGGVYVRGLLGDAFLGGVTQLQVTRFPSALSQCPGDSWNHALETPCRDMGIDPGSDLMVLVSRKDGSQRNAWEIILRTLSSNQPHPDASSPSLIYTTNDQDTWMVFTISVLEDQLAVMFSPYDGPDPLNVAQGGELVVWNWKTGQVRTILRGPFKYPTSFTFISPNVFMVGEVEARQSSFLNPNDRRIHFRAALVVYAIPHQESNHETQVECQKVASFHLPLFKHDVHDVRLSSRSDPAPVPQRWPSAAPPASGNFKPFYMDPLKRIIVLSVDLTLRRRSLFGSGVGHREYTVFVHTDMFTNLLGEQRVSSGEGFSEPVLEFNWKEWQRFARWTTLQRSPGHYVCYVYGQRYIDYEHGPFISRMHLWDFNPSVRRPDRIFSKPTNVPARTSFYSNDGLDKQATYIDPNRDIPVSRKTAGLDEVGPSLSAMNRFAFEPVIETGESVIKDKDVFVYKKVKSSLPFRRTTGRAKLPQLTGIMLDDERIYMMSRLRDGPGVRIGALSMGAASDFVWQDAGWEAEN
ncbi:hypothetical protein FRC04_011691 [Tulasnella sp. 424]|nr:hypothetical protein FRC04_011691 [Tulasnella sp. 424]